MTVVDQVERIRLAASEELSLSCTALETAGLSWSEPKLVVVLDGGKDYTAELKVEFYQDGDLVDLFEFFVCRAGILTTSEGEVRQWISDNVPDVIARSTRN